MKIKVTQRHIEEAERRRAEDSSVCTRCVIGLAIGEHFPNSEVVQAGVYLNGGNKLTKLPKNALDAIHEWDNRKPITPFTFDLDIPINRNNRKGGIVKVIIDGVEYVPKISRPYIEKNGKPRTSPRKNKEWPKWFRDDQKSALWIFESESNGIFYCSSGVTWKATSSVKALKNDRSAHQITSRQAASIRRGWRKK